MSNFNFNSQVCTTKKQSERLIRLGLKKETADMVWSGLSGTPICHSYKRIKHLASDLNDKVHPAWSLHRLLYLIPNEYFTDVDFQNVMQRCIFATSTLYNDLIDLIEALIKTEYFYKEYLEE